MNNLLEPSHPICFRHSLDNQLLVHTILLTLIEFKFKFVYDSSIDIDQATSPVTSRVRRIGQKLTRSTLSTLFQHCGFDCIEVDN